MKTISRSWRMTAVRTLLVGTALMIGTLTTLHAESAHAPQQQLSSTYTQHVPATDSHRNTDSRPDWNVDYPSQLGPQGVVTSDAAASATQRHRSRKDSSQMH